MKALVLLILSFTLLVFTGSVLNAQKPQRVHRIAWIAFDGTRPDRAFMTGLRERGYFDGQSITVEFRSAQGKEERLSQIAAELVRLKHDVIVADTNAATNAVRKATTTIPIVSMHGDPVWDGTVGSLAQPKNNVTGVSTLAFELAGKRLELLRDTFPKIARVAVLLNADSPVHGRQFAQMEKVARGLGVQLLALPLRNSRLDFDALFQRAVSERADAFLALSNPTVSRHRTRVLDFAAKNRLPAIYPSGGYVDAGGLMSYNVDLRELYRRLAYYVDRILKGAKPADLPVEQATKFELVINLNTAKALGLTIPSKVLMWADRVIVDGGHMPERNLATTELSEAQRTAKIRRLGILSSASGNPTLEAFEQNLRELGWVEGQNIAFEYRWAGGNEDRLPALAAELIRMNVDIIFALSTRGALAARRLTTTIPIVTTAIPTPDESGLIVSQHRPGRNVTGLSFMRPELGGKRLELLKETIPRLSRVALLSSVASSQETQIKELEPVARSLSMQLQILIVKEPNEFENAFSSMTRGRVGALSVLTQAMLRRNQKKIIDLAAKNRLPAMYPDSEFADAGGLMSYGPNYAERYRRAAIYVDKILKGAKPADLPVEQPMKLELVVNLNTAKTLGLTIPSKVLMWADRVVE